MPTSEYDVRIRQAADVHLPGVDWRLLKAQFIAESALDPHAISPANAMGLAQVMPGTWEDICKELGWPESADPFDADLSIRAGAYYMGKMLSVWTSPRPEMDRYCLALASYNAGAGHLINAQKAAQRQLRADDVNDYASIIRALPTITGNASGETISYVRRILNYYNGLVTG